MPNTYSISVFQMDSFKEKSGFQNVVFAVKWRLTASDGMNETSLTGNIDVELNENDPFIDYANLTEEEVIGWINLHVSEEEMLHYKNTLDAHLVTLSNPPAATLPLPWSS